MEKQPTTTRGEPGFRLVIQGECQWFALCDNPVAGDVYHSVLGWVPTCSSCAKKLGLTLNREVVL